MAAECFLFCFFCSNLSPGCITKADEEEECYHALSTKRSMSRSTLFHRCFILHRWLFGEFAYSFHKVFKHQFRTRCAAALGSRNTGHSGLGGNNKCCPPPLFFGGLSYDHYKNEQQRNVKPSSGKKRAALFSSLIISCNLMSGRTKHELSVLFRMP